MITFEEIAVTSAGCRCTQCGPGTAEAHASADIFESIAEHQGPGANIALTGADLLSRDDIIDLVTAARDAKATRIRVDVDAGSLDGSVCDRLLEAGVRHVRFTLFAGTANVYGMLAGSPGDLSRVSEGLAALQNAAERTCIRVAVAAEVPICRHNVQELPAAVIFAAENRVDQVTLRLADASVDLPTAVPWIAAACDTGVVNTLWTEVEGVPFCLMPGHDLHLANVVRSYVGAKTEACRACALDPWCDGLLPGASDRALSTLGRPRGHTELSSRVERSRLGPQA